jgi:hypothetical protein
MFQYAYRSGMGCMRLQQARSRDPFPSREPVRWGASVRARTTREKGETAMGHDALQKLL